jgi:hypothetical protein
VGIRAPHEPSSVEAQVTEKLKLSQITDPPAACSIILRTNAYKLESGSS